MKSIYPETPGIVSIYPKTSKNLRHPEINSKRLGISKD